MGIKGEQSPLYNTSVHLDCVFNLPLQVRVRDWKTDKILANCGEIGPTMQIATTMLINEQCPGFNPCDINVCTEARSQLCVPGVTSDGFEQCLSSWREECESDRTCVWWCDTEPYPVQIVLDSEQSTLYVAWRADACRNVTQLRLVTDDYVEDLPVDVTEIPYNLTEVYFMSADELWSSNVLITQGMATVQFPFNSESNYRLEVETEGAYLGAEPIDLLDFNKRQGYPDHFKTFTLQCWASSGEDILIDPYKYSCEIKAKVQLQVFVNGFLRDSMWIGKGQIDLPWVNDRCTIRARSVSGEEIYNEYELKRGGTRGGATATKRVTDDTKAVLFTIDSVTNSQVYNYNADEGYDQSFPSHANNVDDSVKVTQSPQLLISNDVGDTEHVKRQKSGAREGYSVLFVVSMVYALVSICIERLV